MRNQAFINRKIIALFVIFSFFPAMAENPQTASLLHRETALCGEGAIWNSFTNTLFWVDIDGQRLLEWNPATQKNREWHFEKKISTVVPESAQTVVFTLSDEVVRFNIETGESKQLLSIDTNGNAVRFNDGKCDPAGRLWVGTMVMQGTPGSGILYRMDAGATPMERGINCSNGIVWTKDKRTMYYTDTPTCEIVAYDFNLKAGTISNRRVVITIPDGIGYPDGMAIDKNDMLWIAHWGGGGVYHWNPKTGELIGKIGVPAPNITSCAFGGEKLDTLFITSARGGMSKEQLEKYPLSGSLFYYVPGTTGVEVNNIKWSE